MDDHKRTAPVRIAVDWIKILLFIAVLPLVFVVSAINWLITGEPIMSADDILLTKLLLTILSPFITTIFYVLHKHWRLAKDPEYRNPIPAPVVFIITLVLMLVFVKCNFLFGWGFYR
jgi:glucose-6-phosphate-specific signal transduction histidine kinase